MLLACEPSMLHEPLAEHPLALSSPAPPSKPTMAVSESVLRLSEHSCFAVSRSQDAVSYSHPPVPAQKACFGTKTIILHGPGVTLGRKGQVKSRARRRAASFTNPAAGSIPKGSPRQV
jgi:hypothetical protein